MAWSGRVDVHFPVDVRGLLTVGGLPLVDILRAMPADYSGRFVK